MSKSNKLKTSISEQSLLLDYVNNASDLWLKNFEPSILERKPEYDRLYYLPDCPASTTLLAKRDPISGEVIDFIEADNEIAEETAQNSTSLQRMPNPLNETVRGSIMNYPFWPGGFDKPEKHIEELLKIDNNLNFDDEELLVVPPDFKSGYEFDNNLKDNDDEENKKDLIKTDKDTVNLLDVIKNTSEFDEWLAKMYEEDNSASESEDNENLDTKNLTIDSNIFENSPPVQIISKTVDYVPKSNYEWVEVIDTSKPVDDFEKKIPVPAKIWPFELDTFQKQAIIKLENHEYVFVAAHTSAGKTVVAEYAIALSKRHLTKTIYTSPIKALSNQKYRDFKKEFKDVGLITGDMQIEPKASCLIMTTEILRSMLYCGSDVTRDLEYIILDEVHYINDTDRGHVWEEVLILLPDHVTVIMLSATVPNTCEFASWVGHIKKRKVHVISTYKRPVPLMHYLYTVHGPGKIKNNLYCIVNSESKFLGSNYSEAEHNLNVRQKESKKSIGKKNESNIWKELISYLEKDKKLPVIVFVLSRKRCDDLAQFMKNDLNTATEKGKFHIFFEQCIKKLKEPDQELPQIIWMRDSLERGIGVHHSGILPILKEIVEMCFQRGLVKVLFATETFAMGINMPAKTVVFDAITKFDGTTKRALNPSEYIQMAGRAGRRGHDDNGTVIIMCKDIKLPSNVDLNSMILGKSHLLVSKFVLRYAVLLTCLRNENIKLENIVSHTYLEYNSKKLIPEYEKQLQIEKEKYSQLKDIDDENIKPLYHFYDVASEYLNNFQIIMTKWLSHPKFVKELVPGRVLIISHDVHYNKVAILLSRKNDCLKVLVLDKKSKDDSSKISMKFDDKWNKMLSLLSQNKYFHPETSDGHCVLDIKLSDIINVTKHLINKIDPDNIIQNWNQRQMERFKDTPPNQKCIQAIIELNSLNESYMATTLKYYDFNDYLNDLDTPNLIENLNISKMKLNDLLPYTNTFNFIHDFRLVYERKNLLEKIKHLEWKKSWESLSLYPDYCNKLNVLKELGFVNKDDDEVELKGKIAREMGQNEIILTELISNNIIHGLQTAEIAALLSSLIFQAKTQNTPKWNKNLDAAIKEMEAINERIEETEIKYKVCAAEKRDRLNFGLVEVVYEWAQNKPFAQIMKLTDVQEGIIVRCIQQLEDIILSVKTAARRIGDRTLESKMEEVSIAIKRDIVFAASLYTTLD